MRTQLLAAARTPIDGASAHEWGERILELVEEEYAAAVRASERAAWALVDEAREELPADAPVAEPTGPFAYVPMVAAVVRAHARQIDLHAMRRLLREAERCADWIGASLADCENVSPVESAA